LDQQQKPAAFDPCQATTLLRKEMGLLDVVLFNIAAVLGPRWIARAAHVGETSLTMWVVAALFFFVPTALVISELATRYPHEGGLYAWTKEAFGDFHGFVAGWFYWMYTILYFPGLLMASMAMSVYIGGPKFAYLADEKWHYLIPASLGLLAVASILNLVGLNIGKWLQNAGGVSTYVPLVMLVVIAAAVNFYHRGSVIPVNWNSLKPTFDLGTLNFWTSIAFAFTGMELVCTMCEEVREPRKTFRRATYISAFLIAIIYVLATLSVITLIPSADVNTQNGAFQAISHGSGILGFAWLGVVAAALVTVGNAGGVGATVAGAARVPFVAGIDRYLPEAFARLHPKWRTPHIAIIVQALLSAALLIISNFGQNIAAAYEILINATVVVYFIPFLYMYAAAIKLAYRKDRDAHQDAALIPGGKTGVWIAGSLGFVVTFLSIVLAFIPSMDVENKPLYVIEIVVGTLVAAGLGVMLYRRGARVKAVAG
jgi:amino acid transporter